jgi:hypothetical protein
MTHVEDLKIKNSEDLRQAIVRLELMQKVQWAELKEEANELYDKVAPVGNAVIAVSQLLSKPDLKENIFNTALANITDFLAKRLIVRGSDNRFRNMLANMAKFAVLRFFASKQDSMQSAFEQVKGSTQSTFEHVRDFVADKIKNIRKTIKRKF